MDEELRILVEISSEEFYGQYEEGDDDYEEF